MTQICLCSWGGDESPVGIRGLIGIGKVVWKELSFLSRRSRRYYLSWLSWLRWYCYNYSLLLRGPFGPGIWHRDVKKLFGKVLGKLDLIVFDLNIVLLGDEDWLEGVKR
jgi:hypothetical protein